MQVIVNHDGFILGVQARELQGPGTYEVEGGHVVSFIPLPVPPPDASQSDSERSQNEQSNNVSNEQSQPLPASEDGQIEGL